jgi:DNA-binding LacI/PurR family transcriptional regulator
MKDVAQAAGVSVQTVSNFVNGRANQMTTATQARIRTVMKELRFHPNSAARGLRSARSRTLGFLILDDAARFLADPMTDLFLSGLGDVLRDQGYALLIQASRPSNPIEGLLTPVLEGRIDGAVVFLSGPSPVRAQYIRSLRRLAGPFVLLQEHDDVDGEVPSICADDRGGSRDLCRHLIASGHTRIGFLTAAHRWSAIEERYVGYLEAHEEADLVPSPDHALWHGDFEALEAANAAGMMLDLAPAPTAIMCGNDLIALGVLKTARDRGLRVPDDLAVTGFDDFEFAAAIDPPLTTVRIDGYDMGRLAAQELLGAVLGKRSATARRFPTELCLRASA